MFKKFRFFKRFKKLVFGGFAIVSGAIACCLLGSWTIDQNGNLIGENKIPTSFEFNNARLWATSALNTSTYDLITNEIYTISFNITNVVYDQGYGTNNTFFIVTISNQQNIITSNCLNNFYIQSGQTKRCYITFKYNTDFIISLWGPGNNSNGNHGTATWNYFCLKKGTDTNYEPYGVYYSQTNYDSLEDDYNDLQQDYNDLANMRIDYRNYVIKLINYPTSQTTEEYTVVQTLDSQAYINDYGFLDVYSITLLSGFGDTWDGIAVSTELSLNTYNYNLLFNGSGSPNLDFALYYDYYGNDSFSVLPLTNIVGDSYYYGYFDLIGLFGKSNLELDMQNVNYNKFVLHWTNNPSPSDLFDIKLNSSDGYNQGYAQGQREFFQKYEDLRQNYNDINNQLNTLQSNFDLLQQRYDDLSNTDLGFSMSKLMWNIAATPFESFKSIWSVNFLDFNIASFITGILSIFVIVWLLKKIF